MATWLAEEPDIDERNIDIYVSDSIEQMQQPNVAFAKKPHLNFEESDESGLKGMEKFEKLFYVCLLRKCVCVRCRK